MEPVPPIPTTPPAGPPPAAVPPPPPYTPPPQPIAQEPQYSGGGTLKTLDWVQIGFMIAGAFAIFHIVDYYRRKTKQDQSNQATLADLSQQVEKVQMNFDGLVKRLQRRR